MLKMKKAVVKCTGIDMPELDLPMYKSPNRVVHALLESAQDLEQMKMLKAFQQLSQSHQQSNNQQQPQPQDDMFKKMMMKMMMKKLFFNQQEDHHEQNEYKMDLTSPFGNIGNQRSNNKYEMMEQMMKTFMKKTQT